ncbi:MAG: glycosyltransferase [Salinivirgaceae bacterium]|nr:glycosyltransferase [Salinivirgaceae bacterium]
MIKNITILGPAYPFRGGMAAFNERMAYAFLSEGYQVKIENFKLQYPKFLFPGKTQYANWTAPENLNIESETNSVNPLNWIKIGNKIRRQKPDLLIIGYWLPFMAPCMGTIAKIVRKNKHTKIVSVLHNIIPHEKRLGDKMFSNYFVKQIDAFVSLSKSVLSDLEIFDKNKARAFSPHPLYDHYGKIIGKETAQDKLKIDKQYKYVLFFGLIRDYKGLDLLINAFTDKRFKEKNIKLIVAGEFYSNPESYYKLIEDNHLQDEIILHDRFIPDPEVANYFCAADIIAQPYKSATQSGVTQIGFHFEKPMLVTNVGGLSEIIPNNKAGYVVDTNSKDIADKLISFFDLNKHDAFVEFVKQEKKKYSWTNMTKTILDLYHKIDDKNE